MNHSLRSLVTGLAAAVCFWPAGVAARTPDVASAGPALTVDNVRDSYASAGFQVARAQTWTWAAPPVTSLQIRDQSSGRVLMVLVYSDPAVAETARLQAQAQDVSGERSSNPHLIPGYGASVWHGNVALVQTTQAQLDRLFQLQSDCANDLYVEPDLVPERNGLVDVDFQQALTSSTLRL
jgi:hypothetical protein